MLIFQAKTAEEMRSEAVRYLEFVADRFTNNARVRTGKNQKREEENIAAAILACAQELKNCAIRPSEAAMPVAFNCRNCQQTVSGDPAKGSPHWIEHCGYTCNKAA